MSIPGFSAEASMYYSPLRKDRRQEAMGRALAVLLGNEGDPKCMQTVMPGFTSVTCIANGCACTINSGFLDPYVGIGMGCVCE